MATIAQLPTPGTVPFLSSPELLPFCVLLQLATYRCHLPLKSSGYIRPGGRQVGCCLERRGKDGDVSGSFHLALRELRDAGRHLPRNPTSPFTAPSLRHPHLECGGLSSLSFLRAPSFQLSYFYWNSFIRQRHRALPEPQTSALGLLSNPRFPAQAGRLTETPGTHSTHWQQWDL